MFEKFIGNSNLKLLCNAVEDGINCSVFGLNQGEKLALANKGAKLFYVVENLDAVNVVYEKLSALGRTCEILTDSINVFSSEFVATSKTITILNKMKSDKVDTLIITPEIMCQKFPNLQQVKSIIVSSKQTLDITKLIKTLNEFGYRRVDLVSTPNEFTVRGDVVDIYPLGDSPIRVLFDYDTVDSIKYYNPVTMLTTESVKEIEILSTNYYQVDIQKMQEIYAINKCKLDDMYYTFSELQKVDYRLLAFDENVSACIFDFMPDALVCFDGARSIYNSLETYIKQYNANIANLPKILTYLKLGQKLNISKVLQFSDSLTLLAYHNINENNP